MTMAEFLQSKVGMGLSGRDRTMGGFHSPPPHTHTGYPPPRASWHGHICRPSTNLNLKPTTKQIDLLQPRIAKTSRALLGRATLAIKHHVRLFLCFSPACPAVSHLTLDPVVITYVHVHVHTQKKTGHAPAVEEQGGAVPKQGPLPPQGTSLHPSVGSTHSGPPNPSISISTYVFVCLTQPQ